MTLEPNKREEPVRFGVFGFAVRKAGKSAESSPVRRTRISVVSSGQRLCGKDAKQLWKDGRVLEPGLEVAGTCFYDGARSEAVRRESHECGFAKVIQYRKAMFTRRTDVNMGAAGIAVFDE